MLQPMSVYAVFQELATVQCATNEMDKLDNLIKRWHLRMQILIDNYIAMHMVNCNNARHSVSVYKHKLFNVSFYIP